MPKQSSKRVPGVTDAEWLSNHGQQNGGSPTAGAGSEATENLSLFHSVERGLFDPKTKKSVSPNSSFDAARPTPTDGDHQLSSVSEIRSRRTGGTNRPFNGLTRSN